MRLATPVAAGNAPRDSWRHMLERAVAGVQDAVLTPQPLEDGRTAAAVADERGDAPGLQCRA
jgi:hypothetical protein